MPNMTWPNLFESHRKRCGINQVRMSKLLERGQGAISDYESGKIAPPLDLVEEIADLFSLTGAERRTFIEEANLAHATELVRDIVVGLRVKVGRLERRLARADVARPRR